MKGSVSRPERHKTKGRLGFGDGQDREGPLWHLSLTSPLTGSFDGVAMRGYPYGVFPKGASIALLVALLAVAGAARAEAVAFVAAGEPSGPARRATLRCHQLLEGQEGVAVIESAELRRALAGLPARGEGDDPLADVRALVREAGGDEAREALEQVGGRLDVDLLVTVRQAGGELELRGFNVARGAFYRGTLMLPANEPPEAEEVLAFVLPRARAVVAGAGGEAEVEEEEPERRSIWSRWWVWVLIGGAVAVAAVVGYFVTPTQVEDTGVTLRVVVP